MMQGAEEDLVAETEPDGGRNRGQWSFAHVGRTCRTGNKQIHYRPGRAKDGEQWGTRRRSGGGSRFTCWMSGDGMVSRGSERYGIGRWTGRPKSRLGDESLFMGKERGGLVRFISAFWPFREGSREPVDAVYCLP